MFNLCFLIKYIWNISKLLYIKKILLMLKKFLEWYKCKRNKFFLLLSNNDISYVDVLSVCRYNIYLFLCSSKSIKISISIRIVFLKHIIIFLSHRIFNKFLNSNFYIIFDLGLNYISWLIIYIIFMFRTILRLLGFTVKKVKKKKK